ncbi:hypothetical protein EH196_03355 [Bacillus sp. C1-1]|nr:hypothetical protein EH196_03355 [Bacillus sp. C1-1]
MNILYAFFLVGVVAIPIRFAFTGKLEWIQVFATGFFLFVAFLLTLFLRWQGRKDQDYVPHHHRAVFSVRLFDRVSTNKKPLFFQGEKIGYVERSYKKKWHRLLESLARGQGSHHLQLHFSFENGTYLSFQQHDKRKEWDIYKNDIKEGIAQLDSALSALRNGQSCMFVQLNDSTFKLTTELIGQELRITCDDFLIGTGQHVNRYLYELCLSSKGDKEEHYFLLAVYVAFHFIHRK